MKLSKITDQDLIKAIQEDHENLGHVYKRNKAGCIAFMSTIASGKNMDDELNDIFQNAIIILYEKIVDGNFELTSTIQTYMNAVCRFQLLKKIKADKKLVNQKNRDFSDKTDMPNDQGIEDDLEPIETQNEIQHNALERALKELENAGGKCHELLTLFWYHKKSMTEISNHFGYPNDDSTKVQKYKCQKRLQKMAFNYMKI